MKTVFISIIVATATIVLQKSFGNMISGITLFISRSFKKGDKVRITWNGNEITSGYIYRRGLTRTKVKMYNGDICLVANSYLDNCAIINSDITSGTSHIERLYFSLGSNIDKIKEIILDVLLNNNDSYNTEENTNIIVGYDSGKICIQFNIRSDSVDDSFKVCSDVNETLLKRLGEDDSIELL